MNFHLELYELEEAAPTLLSLAVMELLLSLDRLFEVSEGVSHLPRERQRIARLIGGALADSARLAGLYLAAPLISRFLWMKVLGALYLLEIMSAHFLGKHSDGVDPETRTWSFSRTILEVALLDLSLSIGNIVAALSLTRTVWVVVLSVVFWMLVTRLLASHWINLRNHIHALRHSVPVLTGGIGCLLLVEIISQRFGIDPTTPWQQFFGLVALVLAATLYHAVPALQRVTEPVFQKLARPLMQILHTLLSAVFWPLRALLRGLLAR